MIFHVFLILTLVDATEKGIMRRHHKALVAEFDGSLESFDSDGERQRQRQQRQRWYLVDKAETPVENHSYQIAFEMDGQLMCWQRETDGCRQFSGDCEVRYCEPQNCDCMIVQIKRCGDHMDLFTEADWDKDPTASGKLSTEYWRGIRVQYYDPSKWGSNATLDVGKALETTLSCMDETGCSCHQSGWFHWSYPQIGGNLVWSPAGNVTDETIGPSGHWGSRLQQSIVVRVYNDAGQASNMYFIPKDVPLSSRSTTTTTAESTTATTTASVAEESTTEEEDEEIEEATTETTETTVTTTTTTMTTTMFTTTTTTVTITTTTVTTTTTSTVTTTTTTEYLAPEYGHAAFQKAKETGMSDDQAAEIAARVAGRAVQRARGSADTWLQLRDSALAASRAAFAAGQAAGMDTAAAAETACLSGGEVAAELKISTGISGKNKVTKAARLVARRVAGVFRLNREQVEALGQSAEGHASARFAGLEAQKEAQQSGKSWWSVAMAAASAAETDAFTAGKGLNFTAAEVGAHAAGLAAIEVLQALKRPRHKIIKVAGLVARKAGARRGMTSAEAKFAQAMVAQIATVMTDPVLETMFPSTTTTTSTTSTTSTTFTTASTTLLDEEDPTLEE